jgi:addiction module HigA family antidote
MPTSPGDILRCEFLQHHKITQDEFAAAIGMSRLTVNQLLNGKRSITAELALRLAHVTNMTPEFWLNLQMNVDLFEARQKIASDLKKIKPILAAPAADKVLSKAS